MWKPKHHSLHIIPNLVRKLLSCLCSSTFLLLLCYSFIAQTRIALKDRYASDHVKHLRSIFFLKELTQFSFHFGFQLNFIFLWEFVPVSFVKLIPMYIIGRYSSLWCEIIWSQKLKFDTLEKKLRWKRCLAFFFLLLLSSLIIFIMCVSGIFFFSVWLESIEKRWKPWKIQKFMCVVKWKRKKMAAAKQGRKYFEAVVFKRRSTLLCIVCAIGCWKSLVCVWVFFIPFVPFCSVITYWNCGINDVVEATIQKHTHIIPNTFAVTILQQNTFLFPNEYEHTLPGEFKNRRIVYFETLTRIPFKISVHISKLLLIGRMNNFYHLN